MWVYDWVCDTWPVLCQTYGFLPSCRASLPFSWYQIIPLGDRGRCVWTTSQSSPMKVEWTGVKPYWLPLPWPLHHHATPFTIQHVPFCRISVLISSVANLACTCAFRWLKYITEAADVYKDSNPLKTPPRVPRAKRLVKPVVMSDVAEASES